MRALAETVLRYWRTARHLRPRQVAYQLLRPLRRRRHARPVSSAPVWEPPEIVQPVAARGAVLSPEGVLEVLGARHALTSPRDWTVGAPSKLWAYHANYFDFLRCPETTEDVDALGARVEGWIAAFPPTTPVAWDPYPASRRVVNWVLWSHELGRRPSERMLCSMETHLEDIALHLEYDLGGNHLLANAKALLVGGSFLASPRPRALAARGLSLFTEELRAQVLADGGHHERSPMYQCFVLEDVLDVLNVARASDRTAGLLAECAESMLGWMADIVHPDGEVPLFNDAALGMAPRPKELVAYAKRLGLSVPSSVDVRRRVGARLDSGIVRGTAGRLTLLADVGDLGPDHLPAHGHADSLTFELSVMGRRVLVDPGTSSYEDGPVREAERSTRAHNTVEVNGEDSSEMWSVFRVGHRAHTRVERCAVDAEGRIEVSASHDGYLRSAGVRHRRTWLLDDGLLTVRDRLDGRGQVGVALGFLLHPDCEVEARGPEFFVRLRDVGDVCTVLPEARLEWSLEPARYAPRFGVRIATTRIAGRGQVTLPVETITRFVFR